MLLIQGKEYYKVTEVAELSKVNARTLRRWISNGYLDHFLFPFKETPTSPTYYRLEPPEEEDVRWDGQAAYQMPKRDGDIS